MHAWIVLSHLGAKQAIVPFLKVCSNQEGNYEVIHNAIEKSQGDITSILARFGPSIISPARRILLEQVKTNNEPSSYILDALIDVAKKYPTENERIVEVFHAVLRKLTDYTTFLSFIDYLLYDLNSVDSFPLFRDAIISGRVRTGDVITKSKYNELSRTVASIIDLRDTSLLPSPIPEDSFDLIDIQREFGLMKDYNAIPRLFTLGRFDSFDCDRDTYYKAGIVDKKYIPALCKIALLPAHTANSFLSVNAHAWFCLGVLKYEKILPELLKILENESGDIFYETNQAAEILSSFGPFLLDYIDKIMRTNEKHEARLILSLVDALAGTIGNFGLEHKERLRGLRILKQLPRSYVTPAVQCLMINLFMGSGIAHVRRDEFGEATVIVGANYRLAKAISEKISGEASKGRGEKRPTDELSAGSRIQVS